MTHFHLLPKKGWENYSMHKELTKFIYSTFGQFLRERDWNYMNLTSDTGIFEDEEGNYLYIEFETHKKKHTETITKLIVSIEVPNDFFNEKIALLQEKFELVYKLFD